MLTEAGDKSGSWDEVCVRIEISTRRSGVSGQENHISKGDVPGKMSRMLGRRTLWWGMI